MQREIVNLHPKDLLHALHPMKLELLESHKLCYAQQTANSRFKVDWLLHTTGTMLLVGKFWGALNIFQVDVITEVKSECQNYLSVIFLHVCFGGGQMHWSIKRTEKKTVYTVRRVRKLLHVLPARHRLAISIHAFIVDWMLFDCSRGSTSLT